MSFKEQFRKILQKIQFNDLGHQNHLTHLSTIALKYDEEEVLDEFLTIICSVFDMDYADDNPFVSTTLKFLSKALIKVTLNLVTPSETAEGDGRPMKIYDISDCSFFNAILEHILKVTLTRSNTRSKFNLAFFITHLFQNFNINIEIGYNLCDKVIDLMFNLFNERHQKIRIQAIKALSRLQEPMNPDCQVVSLFTALFYDLNRMVRQTAIEQTAPTVEVLPLLIERLTDVADSVCAEAFMKLCNVNPRIFLKIEERVTILEFALTQKNKKIGTLFVEKLIPNWLYHFHDNHLEFIESLHLDEEQDKFEKICEKLVMIFLDKYRVETVMQHLPFDELTKTIPVEVIKLEHVLLWSTAINRLRNDDNEYLLEKLVPELTYLTSYIKDFIRIHFDSIREDWEDMLFQKIVYYLFQICAGYNFGDEAGRRSLYSLIDEVLNKYELHQSVIERIVSIGFLVNNNIESFTQDMVSIIKNVANSVPAEGSKENVADMEFRMTRLKVQMHRLEIQEEEMVKTRDFKQADALRQEFFAVNQNYLELRRQLSETEKRKVRGNDPKVIFKALDILAAVLKLESIATVTPALQECKTEFFFPLGAKLSGTIYSRFLTCIGLFSMIDIEVASEYGKIVCIPLLAYRPNNLEDKDALMASINSVTDLIRLHGLEIVGIEDDQPATLNDSNYNKRRKLYNGDMSEEEDITHDESEMKGVNQVTSILTDILNENDDDLFNAALKSIFQLMILSKAATPKLLSILLCNCYKQIINNSCRYMYLINTIKYFLISKADSREILQKAIVPTVKMMAKNRYKQMDEESFHAEKMLKFFANYTVKNTDAEHDSGFIWDIIKTIAAKPKKTFSQYLAFLLKNLNVPYNSNMLENIDNIATKLENNVTRKYLLDVMKIMEQKASNGNNRDQPNADECNSIDSGKSQLALLHELNSTEEDDDLPSSSSKVLDIPSSITSTPISNGDEENVNLNKKSEPTTIVIAIKKSNENENTCKSTTSNKNKTKRSSDQRESITLNRQVLKKRVFFRKSNRLSSKDRRRELRSSQSSSDHNDKTFIPAERTLRNGESLKGKKLKKKENDENVKIITNKTLEEGNRIQDIVDIESVITRNRIETPRRSMNACTASTVKSRNQVQTKSRTSKRKTRSNNEETNKRSVGPIITNENQIQTRNSATKIDTPSFNKKMDKETYQITDANMRITSIETARPSEHKNNTKADKKKKQSDKNIETITNSVRTRNQVLTQNNCLTPNTRSSNKKSGPTIVLQPKKLSIDLNIDKIINSPAQNIKSKNVTSTSTVRTRNQKRTKDVSQKSINKTLKKLQFNVNLSSPDTPSRRKSNKTNKMKTTSKTENKSPPKSVSQPLGVVGTRTRTNSVTHQVVTNTIRSLRNRAVLSEAPTKHKLNNDNTAFQKRKKTLSSSGQHLLSSPETSKSVRNDEQGSSRLSVTSSPNGSSIKSSRKRTRLSSSTTNSPKPVMKQSRR